MNAAMADSLDLFLRMNIFKHITTGNQVIDMLLSSMIMMYIPTLYKIIRNYILNALQFVSLYKYNSISLEGNRTIFFGGWQSRTQNIFSIRFRALWHYMQKIQSGSKSIFSLKEYPASENEIEDYNDNNEIPHISDDIFIVNQHKCFEIAKDILCKVTFRESEDVDTKRGNENRTTRLETICIVLYSKTKTVSDIQSFLDEITNQYMEDLYDSRQNQLFIYTLSSFKSKNSENDNSLPIWDECVFKSSRTFETIFFEQKQELLDKMDFFENNKEWYDKEGHPYTLGIALHGPPGTGKTSVIKSIANYLKRHLIVIPLSKIKTQTQFNKCFFDSEYTHKNAKEKIGFENKIIVFEDIDCMSDIIMDRNPQNRDEPKRNSESDVVTKDELLNTIKNGLNPDNCKSDFVSYLEKKDENDNLTLSFILNVIDGIRETPGRIIIVTSNHYKKLDKALTRPGRIDISLEMKNASVKTIETIVQHYYNSKIPMSIKNKMRDGVVSPATLVNERFSADSSRDYMNNLIEKYFT